jgi:molybdenum cofactor cytidylyltransferase
MIFGLIPAAGKSERMGDMGTSKLALRVGERTVLELVIAALRDGGADDVVVVLSPHGTALKPIAESTGASALLLPEQTPDMRSTVEAGLNWLEARHAPTATDSWLLAPADHPALDPVIVRRLIDTSRGMPSGAIVIPTWQGRRGHPVLIGWSHLAAIRHFPREHGLNAYLRQCTDQTREVEATSAAVLEDLDTPEDYRRHLGSRPT